MHSTTTRFLRAAAKTLACVCALLALGLVATVAFAPKSALAAGTINTARQLIYKAPFIGSVARTQHDKNRDVVSVKDFGAVGDGVTDDTAAVTSACAATTANALIFPAGTYPITADLTCGAAVLWFKGGAQLKITAGKTFTASGRVISLGGDPTTGTGTITYSKDGNFFANDNGFSFGKTPSVGTDDFFHIRRDTQGSTGIIIRNDDDVGTNTDSYVHMYGGPLTGGTRGSAMRLSAANLASGPLVNIVAENDTAFSLIQQAAAPLDLYTANVRQFQIASVPSAVNFWQFKGGLAASSISLAPGGTDTNISIVYNTKGTGSHFFRTGVAASFQLEVKDTAGATNRVTVTGSNGGAPTVGTSGGNLALTASTNIVSAPSLSVTNTLGGGTITLSTGSGTATVNSGARCVCTDTTANASVRCAVASATLTATGTGSDVIAYLCF